MLPKVQGNGIVLNEKIAPKLILEDHLKFILKKSLNENYKPWKTPIAPKNPHSSFGNFPKDVMLTIKKIPLAKKYIDFENTSAGAGTSTKKIKID
jgi:hypothetical protein